nr:hypothetical protein CFP56_37109 [Quercus suber]
MRSQTSVQRLCSQEVSAERLLILSHLCSDQSVQADVAPQREPLNYPSPDSRRSCSCSLSPAKARLRGPNARSKLT